MRAPLLAVALVANLGLTGCVSNKYKMAHPEITPPAVALNLANGPRSPSASPDIDATIHTVIVHQGPGSWKRAAFWDEYVVTIVNRGTAPLTVLSATLTDFQGEATTAGENPWTLEKQSRRYTDRINETVSDVIRIGGTTVLTSTAAGGIAVLSISHIGTQLGAALAIGGVVTAAAATVVIPIWSVVANVHGRQEIEAEFRRRRLATPLFLVRDQSVQGSFFFRIAPGPRQLALQCRVGDEPRTVTVDLAPLAGLHLRVTAPAAKSP